MTAIRFQTAVIIGNSDGNSSSGCRVAVAVTKIAVVVE